jgi:hypothetical protein
LTFYRVSRLSIQSCNSRANTLAGGADFKEVFIFTGLVASFLKFGQYLATVILEGEDDVIPEGGDPAIEIPPMQCQNGIAGI